MRKWITLLMMALVMVSVANAICCEKKELCTVSETCQDAACGNCSITIYNRDGTLNQSQMPMDIISPYTYIHNLPINLTYGVYPYAINCSTNRICLGDCQIEVVDQCDGNNAEYYIYIVILIAFFIMLGLGYYFEEPWFAVMSGMLAVCLAVALYNYGYPKLDSVFIKNVIVAIIAGIGCYLIIVPSMKIWEDW